MDQELEETDFCVLNQRCNERIARLEREYQVVRRRCVETGAEPIKTAELAAVIRKNLSASAENDDFYSRLLDHMTVCSDGSVEVVLRGLSARWVFVMKKRRGKDISPSSILSTDIS